MAKPIPDGYHAITPYLSMNGGGAFIEFVTTVFDAQVTERIDGPGGLVMHAELKIGDSMLMLADACDKMPALPTGLYVYVADVDETYRRGLAAGATSSDEPKDQFYGDRSGGFIDKWDNRWWVATHIEDVSPEELQRRIAQFSAKAEAS